MRDAILINDGIHLFPARHRIIRVIAAVDSKNIFVIVPEFVNYTPGANRGAKFAEVDIVPLPAGKNIKRDILI